MEKNHMGMKNALPSSPSPLHGFVPLLLGVALHAFLLHSFLVAARERAVIELFGPKIRHLSPSGVFRTGEPIEIIATVTDQETGVAAVRLFYRCRGRSIYREVQMVQEKGERYRALIPAEAVVKPRVEYFL